MTDNHPTVSPEGSKVAFQSFRGGNYEIIVLEGGVETNPANDHMPDWQPLVK